MPRKLNESDKLLVEAINSYLQSDAKLGLKSHEDTLEKMGQAERGLEYVHGQIEEMYALKASKLTFSDSACQAFHKVHNYKYIDDPTFTQAMEKELKAQGIPAEERHKALDFIPDIINELKTEQAEWSESDYGFNPDMDIIKDICQPKQIKEDYNEYDDAISEECTGTPDCTCQDCIDSETGRPHGEHPTMGRCGCDDCEAYDSRERKRRQLKEDSTTTGSLFPIGEIPGPRFPEGTKMAKPSCPECGAPINPKTGRQLHYVNCTQHSIPKRT